MGTEHWVGMDFDGTLTNTQQKSSDKPWSPYFGEPVQKMINIVQELRAAGVTVKIFTARAADPESLPLIEAWLEAAGLEKLPITNVKDYGMIRCYDDRAIQVIPDTGVTVLELLEHRVGKEKTDDREPRQLSGEQ